MFSNSYCVHYYSIGAAKHLSFFISRFKGFHRKFKSLVEGWKKIYDSNVSVVVGRKLDYITHAIIHMRSI